MSSLAMSGSSPTRNVAEKPWPSWPVFGDEERSNLLRVFDSGVWFRGDELTRFEQEYAAFQDARFGVSCTNGTAALEMALRALDIGPGHEVIVPAYTFVATAGAVLLCGARPVFADLDLNTYNLDPVDARNRITANTRALMPVHFAGLPCDMDAFRELADSHGLALIEDACHSWGSRWKGKGTGAIGDCGAFSFQMSKNITAGEGGILLTDDESLADRAWSYANCGRNRNGPWYEHHRVATNLRLTGLQAAILRAQLKRLGGQTDRRERNARYLDSRLERVPGIALPVRDERVTRRSYHLYMFRYLEGEWGAPRSAFLKALEAEGVPCSPGYPVPLYDNPLFESMGAGDSPACLNTEDLCRTAVWIQHALLLAETADMDDIADAVQKIWENRSELSAE